MVPVLGFVAGPVWADLAKAAASSKELKAVVEDVKRSVASSCSASTAVAYLRAIQCFREFCEKLGRSWSSPKDADVILYLQSLKSRGLSFSTLLQQISGTIRFFHLTDLRDPTKSKLVSAIISAAKRLPREVRRANPGVSENDWLIMASLPLVRARLMPSLTYGCSWSSAGPAQQAPFRSLSARGAGDWTDAILVWQWHMESLSAMSCATGSAPGVSSDQVE